VKKEKNHPVCVCAHGLVCVRTARGRLELWLMSQANLSAAMDEGR